MASSTSSTSHTSPYDKVSVLMITFTNINPAFRATFAHLERVFKEYNYDVQCVDDQVFGSMQGGKWSGKSPKDVFEDWKEAEEGIVEEDYSVVDGSAPRDKLLIVVYVGHGVVSPEDLSNKDSQKHLYAANGQLYFDLTELQEHARDWTGRCDCLFVLECCYAAHDGMAQLDATFGEVYVHSYGDDDLTIGKGRTNNLMQMETIGAGMGLVTIGNGEQNWGRRFASNLEKHREPMTVRSRADMIRDRSGAEGYYRQDSPLAEETSIVLAPLTEEQSFRQAKEALGKLREARGLRLAVQSHAAFN